QASGEGVDTVYASTSWAMAAEQEIEFLRVRGAGATSGVALGGNEFANRLIGGAGIDRLAGGAGNDVYFVDNAEDKVSEASGEGVDTVYASTSWAMAAEQEIEVLRVRGAGATSGVTLSGNEFANRLIGGAGIDRLAGGLGDDVYFVDNAEDKV